MTHLSMSELEAGIAHIRKAPTDQGTLELIVRRPAVDLREVVEAADLDLEKGLVGDSWIHRPSRSTPDGSPHPLMQLNVMNARTISLIAADPERWSLAGDQLYLDLDLSHENLPAGARLAIGDAVIEVTEPPHRGCQKFSSRFGQDALRFVNSEVGRALRLRGLNARVVVAGTIRRGDAVTKLLSRGRRETHP
ncbi:MAG: MOSC domain-containing protein [Acidimicrobiia bacterium]